jgi:thiol:disulfide interchange protein DsbD
MTYGYENEVVFPFEITFDNLADASTEIDIKFLVCDDICIPEETILELSLTKNILNVTQKVEELSKWEAQVPIRAPPDLEIRRTDNAFTLSSDAITENSYFFPFDDQVFDYSDPQENINEALSFNVYEDFDKPLSGVVLSDAYYFEINQPTSEIKVAAAESISILTAILFALIGGLILNLMPCVLPVIALKGLSLVKSASDSKTSVTVNAGAYVVGVIITFMIIAFTLVTLKNAGELIGWGYQLQSPFVVTILAGLIFAIGVYLITDLNIGSSLGKFEKFANGSGPINSMMTGALSVIVASPCTAPFMGAALGAALIQPDIYSYLIFFFLALGFALPYFLIALFPSLVNLLPKPGKWMESLKQLFGFMMFGAAIWLLWVLANQVDANSILFVLIGWLLLAFTAWLFIIKIKHAILIGVVIGCAYGYQLFNWDFKQQTITQSNDSISWSADLEKELKINGDAYFINYTAAWCITCKVNEGIAFTDEIFDLFEEKNITYLKADWTNRDPEIAQQIEKYNRSGIPLYIYWSKKLDEPMVLNEILTESYLREVINEN